MTDLLFSLLNSYGLWVLFVSAMIASVGAPVPASILVMASAAVGEFTLWQVALFAFGGLIVGDQIAFQIARRAGQPLIAKLAKTRGSSSGIQQAQRLIKQRGGFAVLLSRTLLSPIAPYVTYSAGALGMKWLRFSGVAAIGAFFWAASYAWLGNVFGAQLAGVVNCLTGLLLVCAIFGFSLFAVIRRVQFAR